MSPRLRLLLALLLPFCGAALQWLLWENWIKPYAWFLFFPVAFLCAWLGGLAGGIAGTLISALLVFYIFLPPSFSLALETPASLLSVVIFLVMGCLFAWFHARLQRALASSEGRFEATFEQAAVGIALVAPNGAFLRVNRQLSTMVGYTPKELIARNFREITHPLDLDAELAKLGEILAGETDTFAMEKRYLHRDGRIVWGRVSVALTRKPDGAPDYFISVIEDITGHRAAEAARDELEMRLQDAKHLAQLGYWHWDLSSGQHLWSPEIYAIYRRDPSLPPVSLEEVKGCFTAESWPKLAAAVELAVQKGVPFECDAEVVHPDGSHHWVIARGEALRDADSQVIALHGSLQDITARKLTELELQRRNRELERFNKASIDRELQMIALKRQVNALSRELGRVPPHDLSFADGLQPKDES